MYIASQKRKENIAEYLLYMWQVEDMIRANDLDSDKLRTNLVDRYTSLTDEQKRELTEWYESLAEMMRREEVTDKGHLQMNRNIMSRLVELHQALLKDPEFPEYTQTFYRALPYIVELRSKTPEAERAGEIETCFNALYGMLMLRLQKREISDDTRKAIDAITALIAQLASLFARDEAGTLKPAKE